MNIYICVCVRRRRKKNPAHSTCYKSPQCQIIDSCCQALINQARCPERSSTSVGGLCPCGDTREGPTSPSRPRSSSAAVTRCYELLKIQSWGRQFCQPHTEHVESRRALVIYRYRCDSLSLYKNIYIYILCVDIHTLMCVLCVFWG